jgi:hypothetical protein
MSLAFIIGVLVVGIVAYVMWSNSQGSFTKNRLNKNAERAAHAKGHEDGKDSKH